MRLRLFALCVALGACSNGAVANCLGRGGAQCCNQPLAQKDVTYAGTSASGAMVTVRIRLNGSATVTWIKDGTSVVEEYSVAPGF